jgi:hypothetical protein
MRNALLIVLLFCGQFVSAQQVGPVIQEFKTKPDKAVHGSFQVRNMANGPLAVTIEPMSFDHQDGHLQLMPLTSNITLQLSETSFRLGPQQNHEVFFNARCATLPCFFQLFATMVSGKHTAEGLQLALHIPGVVYLCAKQEKSQTHCRDYVLTQIFKEAKPQDNRAAKVSDR